MALKSGFSDEKQRYRIFDHTADLGIEIYGSDEKELFTNAAYALLDTMADMDRIEVYEKRRFAVGGSDWEDLLVNFLREILSLFNGEELLLREFSISYINSHYVTGEAGGEVFNPEKHQIKMEIKAVTYHQVRVEQTPDGWKGRVIFDV
jgi:SHS2 domain-containing protein